MLKESSLAKNDGDVLSYFLSRFVWQVCDYGFDLGDYSVCHYRTWMVMEKLNPLDKMFCCLIECNVGEVLHYNNGRRWCLVFILLKAG